MVNDSSDARLLRERSIGLLRDVLELGSHRVREILRPLDAMALLGGISNGRYYELKKTHKGVLTQDELTRVSLLIGIFKALNILFNEKLANQWVSRPNSNPMFNNAPPLALLIEAGIPGMLAVRRLLDGRRGGR